MPSPTFSKFISLDYKEGNRIFKKLHPAEIENNKSSNEKFYEILHYSSLYGNTFENLNDIDECTYSISYSKEFLAQHDEIIANILDKKRNKRICCFSRNIKRLKEDLMWAHYANGCLGVRINFEIPKPYLVSKRDDYQEDAENKKIVFPVKYDDESLTINNQPDAVARIIEIMTRKKKCWSYEQEYRAIFKKDISLQYKDGESVPENRFPIIIKEIILGRKFCKINEPSSANGHIKGIAKQIQEILLKSGKYNEDTLPKIKSYRERYTNEIAEIKE